MNDKRNKTTARTQQRTSNAPQLWKTGTALIFFCLTIGLSAQPAKTRTTTPANTATRSATTTGTKTTGTAARTTTQKAANTPPSRAELMFPTAVAAPADPTWRRDLYREINLQKDENAPLYYPTEPQEGRVNLFTLLFQLLNQGKIPAYNYDTNMLENFTKENRMHFKDMLDRYSIFYEVKGNTIEVNPSDIPSDEVLSYFIKESSYFDQNTATYHSRVTAICPILHRAPDFGVDRVKYPLFWVKIDDIEKYLSQNMLMTSNINNAAKMSMADFFATNKYKGEIFMTTNMQGKTLQQTTDGDTIAYANAQRRIEKEMADFERHIWATPVDSAAIARRDSIAQAELAARKAKKATPARTTTRATASSSTRTTTKTEKPEKAAKASGSTAPRVSVRRERH